MDIEITSLLGVLVAIAGTIGGFYIKALLGKVKTEKIDAISKYAWMAVRAAKDVIKEEGRGTDKYNLAIDILKKNIKIDNDMASSAIRAAYQLMKSG